MGQDGGNVQQAGGENSPLTPKMAKIKFRKWQNMLQYHCDCAT